jgi:protein PhnA
MSQLPPCPVCKSPYTYEMDNKLVCPECAHEWVPEVQASEGVAAEDERILDANGIELANGDNVVVIKDLPVKGFAKSIKSGTKVRNIRLRPGSDHNIDCKIDDFGSMALKSEFVRKAV